MSAGATGTPESTLPADSTSPVFGHAAKKYFAFDPSYINLNHGSYGSVPLPVLEACDKIGREQDACPDKFYRLLLIPRLEAARSQLATFVGAATDEVVFVPNATHGINTVLRNFIWHADDVIVGMSTTYGSISKAMQYIADVPPHPTLSIFQLTFPTTHSTIIDKFCKHIKDIPRKNGQKIVAIIDSIVSNPGVKLPWQEMVKVCKEFGIWSVIDGAHSIGQELNLNLKDADPDFWVSNCHKWLFCKRGCAILYAPKKNQHIIRTTLPTSHNYKSIYLSKKSSTADFVNQFDWTGTIDFTSYLSVIHAFEFREMLGGEQRINDYCHHLALEGGKCLAEVLKTYVMDDNGELVLNMVNVKLPLDDVQWTTELNDLIDKRLLEKWNIYAAHFYHDDKWWTRCSAQIWNEIGDFEYLGHAFLDICTEIHHSLQQHS
ncbi:PLP-dependent transferase [Rickenella mellea]|uniref:PLP-dependent transferase n=1 Tax=Rickenella mellea TaxID=50990 RepID=A0A4Y7PJ31_9AGAM|nr:PLP-dependent transferase [Rickenella mellea]